MTNDEAPTRDLTDCPNCTEYVTKRLSTVLRLWHEETDRKVWVGSFLVGLHARHESGEDSTP